MAARARSALNFSAMGALDAARERSLAVARTSLPRDVSSRLAALRADRSRGVTAVEESLRLEPAAARVDRYATADTELGGASIQRGDLVIVSLTAANRDPDTFPDPDVFDLSRPNSRSHLAFAQGPHACIGVHLAKLETQSALDAVLDAWPGLQVDPGSTSPTGVIFRKPRSLPVRWDV